YARLGFYARALASYGIDSRAGVFSDDALDQIAIVGTPDDARAKLAEFRAAGVDAPLLGPMATAPDTAAEYQSFLALRDA
ncbi:MAG: LLM class flavin-dependent oxidoreductase, partial [Dehalococcoidia bacterium]|nr:LLM class flavin-dependent oxidoreductase [Dehalococcoidia bacterium]